MAAQYRPALPFSTPLILLKPTYQTALGVHKPIYPAVAEGTQFFASFKTYGGTENAVDGRKAP